MYGIKFRYGLTKVQYLDLIADQEYKCMICECELADPCVDHDHQTGRVRGIICRSCNTIIGIAKDSPELLRRAAVYVEKREP